MVTIRNLKKGYKSFPVLRGLNMDIYDGDVYGFLGRNGCGKTTTMNIIANVIPKDEGDIQLGHGERRIKIGYLPESPTIFAYMTAREYLEYIAACVNYEGDIAKRTDEVLEIVGLRDAADRRSKGFSRGMTQRLGMGAAIFRNPELLIFDEPTSALDPQGRVEVINIINRLKSMGCTIVLSTHILSDVERVANRIGIMNGGVLAEEGEIGEILRKYGGDVVNLKVRNLTQENKIALLKTDFARAEFDNETGQFRFGTDNAEETARRLIKLLADSDMIAESFNIGTATLEEVFGKVVG
ncbi:MAG: ABC transporter ATP-binding protein [Lachnospiraceae bacterium]|nr:ABC transporter ATP-binding protein [Ruminococcus sp.]MCM1274892.1 ABC transporter ATP-binding protein [Lachnospiraceae bacterium]